MRTLDGDKFSAKKPREWNRVEQLQGLAGVMGKRRQRALWKKLVALSGWITARSKTVA